MRAWSYEPRAASSLKPQAAGATPAFHYSTFQRMLRLSCSIAQSSRAPSLLRQHPHFGSLCLVRMLPAAIYLQLAEHLLAQLRLGEHARDGVLDDLLRLPVKALTECFRSQSTRVSGITPIQLLLGFHARYPDLLGVDDDH